MQPNLEKAVHKSKLGGFIIDCQTADLDGAARFWGQALGLKIGSLPAAEETKYRRLDDGQHGLHIEVQTVAHQSRVHLDIETDDIDAEVKRLEALGARRVQQVSRWWVMEAPTGQRFCVVNADSPEFEQLATRWE
jgi:predicted enzyme related to lactoylglutathione lyase